MMRATKTKAESRFAETNHLEKAFQQELLKEQEERAAKTARLRALRLTKEAREREAQDQQSREQIVAESKSSAKKARLIKRPTTAQT